MTLGTFKKIKTHLFFKNFQNLLYRICFCVILQFNKMMMNWKKHVKIFLVGFVLWLLPLALSAQRTVSGRITDAESGEPVYGASVFITGTTVGASTDTSGNYHLKLPASEGNFRMSVSHVGYQPVYRDVEPGITSQTIHIDLKLQEMEEVTITAKTNVRKSDIDL